MFTQIQTHNDKAMVTGAALKKLILERLPNKRLEQMHTADLTGKTDQEIVKIIPSAGRTAEKWEAARNNLDLKASLHSPKKFSHNEDKPEKRNRKFKKDRKSSRKEYPIDKGRFKMDKTERGSKRNSSKLEGIDSSEVERQKAAGECLRCACPASATKLVSVRNTWVFVTALTARRGPCTL